MNLSDILGGIRYTGNVNCDSSELNNRAHFTCIICVRVFSWDRLVSLYRLVCLRKYSYKENTVENGE